MSPKNALIIGSQGQDGQLLHRHLHSLGYLVTPLSKNGTVDICDPQAILQFIKSGRFDEIYHLAAFHHSSQEVLQEDAEFFRKTFEVNFFSLLNILESCRLHSPNTRIFYAASSHIFAASKSNSLLSEESELCPLSAYAQSKLAAKFLCKKYRESHKIFATCGILFNHESELRPENFLSKKIIKGLIRVKNGQLARIELGDLHAEFDMGWAEDFVRAMHLVLQLKEADDYVIATSVKHSVQDFVNVVAHELGINPTTCVYSPKSVLQREPLTRIGDFSKLKAATSWSPSVSFEQMVLILLKKELN